MTRCLLRQRGQTAFRLTPSAENEFVFPAADVRIVFDVGDDSIATSLTLFQGWAGITRPHVLQVTTARSHVLRLLWMQHCWTTMLANIKLAPSAIISVVTRDGQLYVQLTGQAAYPVFRLRARPFFLQGGLTHNCNSSATKTEM